MQGCRVLCVVILLSAVCVALLTLQQTAYWKSTQLKTDCSHVGVSMRQGRRARVSSSLLPAVVMLHVAMRSGSMQSRAAVSASLTFK